MNCEYCVESYETDRKPIMDDGEFDVSIARYKNELSIYVDGPQGCYAGSRDIGINFCPMCGRKMEVSNGDI